MTSKWRLLILACTILLTAGMAMADDCGNGKDHGKGTPSCGNKGNGGNGGQGGNGGSVGPIVITNDNLNNVAATSSSRSSSAASSTSNSSSNATGGNATATGGNASASQSQTANGGNASNGGQSNTQVSTVNQVHQTASAIAPEAYPTAPCRVSGSGGGSSPFFGVSFSGSKLDTECEKRETARSFALIGEREAAVQLLCSTKAAKQAKIAVCAPVPVANKQ